MTGKGKAVYRPEVFGVRNIDQAMRIILTPEQGTTTEERWAKETPYLTGELVRCLKPGIGSVVIDYGCGIGRLAKELIAKTGCAVIGVDIRAEMRALANSYVNSDNFVTVSPAGLKALTARGLKADLGYSVWVLQHCFAPAEDVGNLHDALRDGGLLYVVNGRTRCVPTDQGWKGDGQDVAALLEARFEQVEDKKLPVGVTTQQLSDFSYCRLYRARKR